MPNADKLPQAAPSESPSVCKAASIDWGTMLEDLGGDECLLRELVEAFVATYPETLQEIHQALQHCDLRTVARGAHKLKGAVSNFGLGPAYDAARALEEAAVAARLPVTRDRVATVEREFESLAGKLQAHFRATAP